MGVPSSAIGDPSSGAPLKVETVSRDRLRRSSARWHEVEHSGHTYCLPPGTIPAGRALPSEVLELLRSSETGGILFWSLAESRLVLPPFPVDREADYPGWHVGPLQSLLDRPRRVLVVLVRFGGFAIGVFEGQRLATSKVGSPFVKGRHRAGGSSSGRFARRREGQERMLFDKACETVREQVETYAQPIEHLILGGDRLTLQAFEKRCAYLHGFKGVRLHRVMDVPDPRLDVLKESVRLAYMSRLVTFTPPTQAATARP